MSFRDSVPVPALVLVITAVSTSLQLITSNSCLIQIKAALEEYTTGTFVSAKFDAEVYGKVYANVMTNIDAVLVHDYHGPRFSATLERWARTLR